MCIRDRNNTAPTDPIISENFGSTTTITYSIIQSGSLDAGTTISSPTNKPQGTDPLFVNAPAAGLSTDGDFHVMPGSPAIDMGLNSANTYPTDLDYNIRIQGASIDIGAYETDGPDCLAFMNQTTVYVDSSATGANTGTSWADAFTDLQDALSVVNTCGVDTVKVAHGTYFPSKTDTLIDECSGAMTIVPVSRSDFFHLPDGITVLGGYPTGGEANGPRDPHCNITILSGDIDHNGDSSGNTCSKIREISTLSHQYTIYRAGAYEIERIL